VIVGRSPAIRRALALAERFARTTLPILLVGATGTGKELFAEFIHRRSRRRGPLVDVNCGALPREMVESLLFGHRRGSFTGASESVKGHVERSSGGTLFLDELATLVLEGQVKLLRVIETGTIQALGSASKITVDLRIVSAVQAGILRDVEMGRFRRDLYQRVAGVVVELPPLSARPEDIVPLSVHFAALRGQRLEPAAEQVLLNYSWPGNVRELRLAIERAGELVEDGVLPAAAVVEGIALGAPSAEVGGVLTGRRKSKPRCIELQNAEHLVRECEAASWNIEEAARGLGVSRASLYRWLRAFGIKPGSVSQSQIG
jgi:transcriptional regulator with PAS, ATPase and Fis domain